MLMPAAVLIVLVLGAIAVDSAILYLAQREAYNIAFDAANDAAGAGFDAGRARSSGDIVYTRARVEAVARESVAAAGARHVEIVGVTIEPGDVVAVTVAVTVDHLFDPAFGRAGTERLEMTARAAGESGAP